ncbi:hypothetical protein BDR26DRAFT_869583 [Obelidium mucronatum]|nr:hypothetical protein BDR26DRAFT_869583 [Obelidium mucronatum]
MALIEEIPDRRVHLVTGSNTGVGFGIATRLITLAIESKQPTIVGLLCRTPAKANAAKKQLIQSAAGKFGKQKVDEFVEVSIVEVDLSNAKQVVHAAGEIRERFNRIDSIVFNAGMVPVSHLDIWRGTKAMLRDPTNFAKTTGECIVQKRGGTTKDEFKFGEAFAANFLGHYILLKELEKLLESTSKVLKREGGGIVGSRVVWTTSDTADHDFFDESDFMCLEGSEPYESSKRLIELIHFETAQDLKKKGIYSCLANPGISATDVMQGNVPVFVIVLVLYFLRLLGLRAICVTPFNAAKSGAYLAAEVKDLSKLDQDLSTTAFQSDVSYFGKSRVRMLPLSKKGIKECKGDVCSLGVDVTALRVKMDDLWKKVKESA